MGPRRDEFSRAIAEARRKRGVALLGICNVTPDSFSDGGAYLDADAARAHVDALVDDGADVIDVGGESTRPSAPPVPSAEQLRRVLDVVRFAAGRAPVSIDTSDPEVAAACLDAGACAVNDTSCLRDERLAEVVARFDAALILMHARGTQTAMRGFSACAEDAYGDVVADVLAEWERAAARAEGRGVTRGALYMDPGLGFQKSAHHSLALLARTDELVVRLDVPVLVGASRKSFLTLADADAPPRARLGASIAAAICAAQRGAAMLRVHDVRATRQALGLLRLAAEHPVASEGSRA